MEEINYETALKSLMETMFGRYRGIPYEIHPHGFIFKNGYYSTERALFEAIDRWIEGGRKIIGNSLKTK